MGGVGSAVILTETRGSFQQIVKRGQCFLEVISCVSFAQEPEQSRHFPRILSGKVRVNPGCCPLTTEAFGKFSIGQEFCCGVMEILSQHRLPVIEQVSHGWDEQIGN